MIKHTDLFIYKFGGPLPIPPNPHQLRRVKPSETHPLMNIESRRESPLFWRPKLLVARMNYLKKTERYNPYLRREVRLRSTLEQQAIEDEFKAYIRLKEGEEKRKNGVIGKQELVEYIKVLEDRKEARKAEAKADADRMKVLREELKSDVKKLMDKRNMAVRDNGSMGPKGTGNEVSGSSKSKNSGNLYDWGSVSALNLLDQSGFREIWRENQYTPNASQVKSSRKKGHSFPGGVGLFASHVI